MIDGLKNNEWRWCKVTGEWRVASDKDATKLNDKEIGNTDKNAAELLNLTWKLTATMMTQIMTIALDQQLKDCTIMV